MLPTPSTSHVTFDTIYEPAEDSYLLLDTLSSASETLWLHHRFPPESPVPLAFESGSGSGVVIAFLTAHAKTILGREDILTFAGDVNVNACHATKQTVTEAKTEHKSVAMFLGSSCSDLVSCLIKNSLDLVIFNPPYVPTSELPALPSAGQSPETSVESGSHLLSLSYAGGAQGMETTYRLLKALPEILSARGIAYVLLCAQNKPEVVKAFVRSELKLCVETVGTSGATAGWERLQVIRIWA